MKDLLLYFIEPKNIRRGNMKAITKSINYLTKINGWISSLILGFLMIFITYSITSRLFGHPVIGDIEVVQVSLVIIIMASLSYTEADNKHIAIGLLVDHLPKSVQLILDIISSIFTFIVGLVVAYAFFILAINELSQSFIVSTSLLKIPHYPLKFFISFGFFMWGLQAFLKIIYFSSKLTRKESKSESESYEAIGG
jgi:TRAP-type C4-dicarboxylate transport system permease small subunit